MRSTHRNKSFLQHPTVFIKKEKKLDLTSSTIPNPQELETRRQWIISRKRHQIQLQKQKLDKLRHQNGILEEEVRNYEEKALREREELDFQAEELNEKLQSVEKEIEMCQQFEEINVEQFIEWRYAQATTRHFERVEELRRKCSEENTHKIEKITHLTKQLEEAKRQLKQLELLREREEKSMVMEEREEDIQMPNVRALGSEIGFLREKVRALRENKKIIVDELKSQLNSSKWSVKDNFEVCKERINKEIKRLLAYLEKPDKEVLKANNEKMANPLTLIEAYEARLNQLQRDLPEQLRNEQILKCLKPLPWRSIKGSNIDPSTSSTSEIMEKFNKMQKQFVDVESRNNQLKASVKEKEFEIEKLTKILAEADEKIKQLKK